MAYDNPPTDASPKNLLVLCAALSDGSRTVDELADSDSIDLSKSVIRDTTKYGKRMGFITEDDDGNLSLSDRGWDIAFVDDLSEAVEEPFRTGIRDYGLYADLVDKIIEEELVDQGTPSQITQKQVLPLLNRSFGFSELSTESTLKPATNTFLQTLEAAGYGEYVVGRRDNPTRIELNDEFMQLNRLERESPEDAEYEGDEESESEPKKLDHDFQESDTDSDDESHGVDQDIQIADGNTEVNIEIEISSADWSSEEVVHLLESLKDNRE